MPVHELTQLADTELATSLQKKKKTDNVIENKNKRGLDLIPQSFEFTPPCLYTFILSYKLPS